MLMQFLGLGYAAKHAVFGIAEHEFCAIGFDEFFALIAHGFGHDDYGLVAFYGSHHGQPHTGVAARWLYDCAARAQSSTSFGSLNHGKGHTVFNASAWVEVFQLDQNLSF